MAIVRFVAILALLGASGCISESSWSVSASSKSIQSSLESSSSPFESSSASSGAETAREANYRADVRDYVGAWAKSGGTYADFQQSIADLAQQHGITDWQGNRYTWLGVGEGLRKAGVQGVALDTYVKNFSEGNPTRAQLMRQGYDQYR
jgi:hypothetical protein